MARCLWCPDNWNHVADDKLLDHVREYHPHTIATNPDVWPDTGYTVLYPAKKVEKAL